MPDDLVMESTTDSPEEIRAGLGLAPEPAAPVVAEPSSVIETADAEPDAEPVAEPETPAAVPDPALTVAAPVAEAPKPAKGRKPVAAQARFDELTKKNAEERAARVVAETEAAALRTRLADVTAGPTQEPARPATPAVDAPDPTIAATFAAKLAALGPKPKQTDFDDFDTFDEKKDDWIEARATLKAQATLAQERAADRRRLDDETATRAAQTSISAFEGEKRAVRARHADYDEAMTAVATVPIFPHVTQAVFDSPVRAEIVYRLAKDPARVEAMNAMSPLRAAAEIGKLEVEIAAADRSTGPTGATQTGPATSVVPRPTRPVSRAPEPQSTVLGGASASPVTDLERVETQADYNRIRNAQDRAKRGR